LLFFSFPSSFLLVSVNTSFELSLLFCIILSLLSFIFSVSKLSPFSLVVISDFSLLLFSSISFFVFIFDFFEIKSPLSKFK